MFKEKLIVASFLVLSLGLTACNDGEVNEPPQAEENQNNNEVDDNQDIQEEQNNDVDNETDKDNNENIEEDLSGAQDLGSYGNISITVKEAYNIFIGEKPNSDLQKVELDYDNDIYYYKIEGHDGEKRHEMKIDAHTGEVTKLESKDKDKDKDKDKTLDAKYLEKIDELVRKSIDDSGEGFISMEWDLDEDDGVAELEVKIEREAGELEYTYNLETGELLKKDS